MLESIPRVRALSLADFRRKYVQKSQPVIISDLQLGPGLDAVRTTFGLSKRFGHVRVEVHPEYYGNLLRTGRMYAAQKKTVWWTIGQYLAHIKARPSTSLLCTEQPLPDELIAELSPPRYCSYRYNAREGVDSRLFIANRGNFAHLHFDEDFNQVLLHALVGRRQVVLLPPRSARALNPIGNFSTVSLERMTSAQRRQLARDLGGTEMTLYPGETLYMPPRVWHFVFYRDDGMSINFRWGRDPVDTSLLKLPMGTDLQAVASFLYEQPKTTPLYRSLVRELKSISVLGRKTPGAFSLRCDALRWLREAIERSGGVATELPLRTIIELQGRERARRARQS